MAKPKYRCFLKCFAYNKLFKQGDYFPAVWIEKGYVPQPEYFVLEQDYEDAITTKVAESRIIYSAAEDPRPTKVLIEDLAKFMEVPKDWDRKRIWKTLKQREMAIAHTEPQPRKPGRPAKEA
jgi:hypothetical protein